jgi:hypothetical protein
MARKDNEMPTIREMQLGLVENVNGIIIGDVTFPYEFWTKDGKERIDRNFFVDDDDAVAWFKERHPEQFAAGVEMRVFDRPAA